MQRATSSQIGGVLKLRIILYDSLKTGRNLNVDIMSQRELTLVDLVWIFGALIFLALMCFCMVLFARGANQLATTQAQAIPASTPAAASLRPLSESNREAHPQSVTAITPQESQNIGFVSTPAQASSEVPNRPTKWTQSPRATDKLATTNSGSAKAIRGNRRNLAVMRLASRRRSAVEKGVPRTVKMLIKMWHRTSRTGKLALNGSH